MRTTNENIRQLLEMLDKPDAYTEQEIRDIINHDEDSRDAYRMMVEAKRSSRHQRDEEPIDVDAAWQRFEQRLQPKRYGWGWMKIAASFIGVLLVSSIAFAAIHIVRQQQTTGTTRTEMAGNGTTTIADAPADTLASDSATVQPVVYDNTPLERMLPEIAAHYGVKVTFASAEARELRFRFVWNPQQGIDQVVSDLNQFERLTVRLKDNQVTVE
ncbi:MAG: DUF4974 domain-containing protein [Prevotella sp.]|nr:DUF4974 domain-containing protein [Prevotella sp.]